MTQKVASQKKETFTLLAWIEMEGVSTIARALGCTPPGVRHWRRGYVFPNSLQLMKICKLTRGRLDIPASLAEHFSERNRKKRKTIQERRA